MHQFLIDCMNIGFWFALSLDDPDAPELGWNRLQEIVLHDRGGMVKVVAGLDGADAVHAGAVIWVS